MSDTGENTTRRCPYCGEEIGAGLRRCPCCAEALTVPSHEASTFSAARAKREPRLIRALRSPMAAWLLLAVVIGVCGVLAASRGSLSERLAQTSAMLARSRGAYEAEVAKSSSLEYEVDALQKEVDSLESTVQAHQRAIGACQDAIGNYRRGVSAIRYMLRSMHQDLYLLALTYADRATSYFNRAEMAARDCSSPGTWL